MKKDKKEELIYELKIKEIEMDYKWAEMTAKKIIWFFLLLASGYLGYVLGANKIDEKIFIVIIFLFCAFLFWILGAYWENSKIKEIRAIRKELEKK